MKNKRRDENEVIAGWDLTWKKVDEIEAKVKESARKLHKSVMEQLKLMEDVYND